MHFDDSICSMRGRNFRKEWTRDNFNGEAQLQSRHLLYTEQWTEMRFHKFLSDQSQNWISMFGTSCKEWTRDNFNGEAQLQSRHLLYTEQWTVMYFHNISYGEKLLTFSLEGIQELCGTNFIQFWIPNPLEWTKICRHFAFYLSFVIWPTMDFSMTALF